MKNLKFGFLGIAFTLSLLFAGCADPCKNVTCAHGGCTDGECVCPAGYSGSNCGTSLNVKFGGDFSLNETCSETGIAGPYAVQVEAKSSPLDVTFVGLWEVTLYIVNGEVSDDGMSFRIAKQTLLSGYDIECESGTITADGNTISMTYNVFEQGVDTFYETCSAILMRL